MLADVSQISMSGALVIALLELPCVDDGAHLCCQHSVVHFMHALTAFNGSR
jgi:hypothetical protein